MKFLALVVEVLLIAGIAEVEANVVVTKHAGPPVRLAVGFQLQQQDRLALTIRVLGHYISHRQANKCMTKYSCYSRDGHGLDPSIHALGSKLLVRFFGNCCGLGLVQ